MYIMSPMLSPISSSCDVSQCTRLFRNAFRIKGTPENTVKTSSKRIKRLIGMASGSQSSNSSPEINSSSPCLDNQNEHAAIFSPNSENSTPHKAYNPKFSKPRLPLEEFDPNSQDSGYGGCVDEKSTSFQFAEPFGVAPRRLSLESRSPMKSPVRASPQRKRVARSTLFRSTSSGYESTDDGFNDLIDMESLDSDMTQLPSGMSSLISGDIVSTGLEKPMEIDGTTTPETCTIKPARQSFGFRRALSMQDDLEFSPPSSGVSRVRSCLFRSPSASSSTAKLAYDESPKRSRDGYTSPPTRSFKRPEPPGDEHSPILVKRSRKCTSFQDVSRAVVDSSPPTLTRSLSETEAHAHIKHAIHRSTTDSDLTGDFSKPCVLPLADGHHEDLKSISAETLARLMRGEFADQVSDFKVVDCRYPYEFEAGHISGALNLYTKELIEKSLLMPQQCAPSIEPDTQRRRILVFHCEFSWERGPNLSRFLRNVDRQRNKEHYPALHYPEIYLLHGGYQKFYKDQKELCLPQGYRPMRHPDHEADLRHFRAKSKSWQGEKPGRANVASARATLKRLGF